MTHPASAHDDRSTYVARARRTGPVLVAVKGGDCSAVLEAARLVAPRVGASEFLVYSVVELPVVYNYGPEAALIPQELHGEWRADRFDAVRNEIARTIGQTDRWKVEAVYGEPATRIAAAARERNAPLIVMGIGRHRPIERLLAGETTVSTIRRADRPVLAVSGEMRALPRTVVAAVDFSPASIWAAETALSLTGADATVYLVHVWSRVTTSHPHPMLVAADDAYERGLPARFERLASDLHTPPGTTVRAVTLHGNPVEHLLDFAQTHGADLVVGGTHGPGFVERLLLGSVTTALLRGATCSVLIAPEPPLAERDRIERHMTGTFESRSPDEWAGQLDAFTRRNKGRRTVLEVDEPRLGAQLQEVGYTLLGAAYDRHDRRVEIMLGAPGGAPHLTRTIGDVEAVSVASAGAERDRALRVRYGEGQTLLTFPGD